MTDEDVKRAGIYKKTTEQTPTEAMPGAVLQPAPPLPPTPLFNPNDQADVLAQQMLENESLQGLSEEEYRKKVDDAKKTAKEYLELTPADRWLRNVKMAKLEEPEANKILDDILSQGYWEKTYNLFHGRLKITLRSRDMAANQRVADAMDSVRTYDKGVMNQAKLRIQLAVSLVKFKDKALPVAAMDAPMEEHNQVVAQRLAFCDRFVPGPASEAIYAALIDFDNKTYAVMSEGASSAF